jgi:predicted PurR-regulated permease PerM
MFFRLLSVLLVVWFLYAVREIFPPFIVGAIIAYLLLPIVEALSSSAKIDKRVAVAVIYLLFVFSIAGLVWWFGPHLSHQLKEIADNKTELVSNLLTQIKQQFGLDIDVKDASTEILSSMEQSFGKPAELMHYGTLVSKTMLALLVCVVSSIYLIVDNRRVGHFFLRFMPEDRRHTAIGLSQQMNKILSKYVQGQLILITIMAVVAYIVLHFVFHIKYALLIALLSGFLEIIPVLGPILATSTATLVGISQNGFDCALWIILCYTAARWAEDYVIVPRIIGHAVDLHPLAVIFAVLCGEVLAGGLGMLIAIPVAASIKVILDFLYPSVPQSEVASLNTVNAIQPPPPLHPKHEQ